MNADELLTLPDLPSDLPDVLKLGAELRDAYQRFTAAAKDVAGWSERWDADAVDAGTLWVETMIRDARNLALVGRRREAKGP